MDNNEEINDLWVVDDAGIQYHVVNVEDYVDSEASVSDTTHEKPENRSCIEDNFEKPTNSDTADRDDEETQNIGKDIMDTVRPSSDDVYETVVVDYQAQIKENRDWEWNISEMLDEDNPVMEENEDEYDSEFEFTEHDNANTTDANSSQKEDIPLESDNVWDEHEKKEIEKFYGERAAPCCKLNCNQKISKILALSCRHNIQDLTKSEQDLILLSYFQGHCRLPSLNAEYPERRSHHKKKSTDGSDSNSRSHVRYVYHDVDVCLKFFQFLYDVGPRRMKNLMSHFKKFGLTERRHQNLGHVSTNKTAMALHEREDIISFIASYAEKHSIPLPGRLPNCKDFRLMKLPASVTKIKVYREYVKAVEEENAAQDLPKDQQMRVFGYKTFLRVWNTHLPNKNSLSCQK